MIKINVLKNDNLICQLNKMKVIEIEIFLKVALSLFYNITDYICPTENS